MTTELQDILDVVNRLNSVRSQSPLPLRSHLSDRPRDGPDRHPESLRGPKRVTGRSGASQTILRFDYHSKGKS